MIRGMTCATSPQPAGSLGRVRPAGNAADDDEVQLVERAKRDPRHFALLYDRHFEQIYRFVYSRVRAQDVAEDVTSEVFMKALAAMPRYQLTGRPFAAWLYRIAVNTIADRGRVFHVLGSIEDCANLSVGPSTEDLALQRDEMHRIWTIVNALPCEQRAALELRYRNDMRVVDIAAVMGKSSGAVKQLIFRALGHLRLEAKSLRPAV